MSRERYWVVFITPALCFVFHGEIPLRLSQTVPESYSTTIARIGSFSGGFARHRVLCRRLIAGTRCGTPSVSHAGEA